jgi:hypothetical protein
MSDEILSPQTLKHVSDLANEHNNLKKMQEKVVEA